MTRLFIVLLLGISGSLFAVDFDWIRDGLYDQTLSEGDSSTYDDGNFQASFINNKFLYSHRENGDVFRTVEVQLHTSNDGGGNGLYEHIGFSKPGQPYVTFWSDLRVNNWIDYTPDYAGNTIVVLAGADESFFIGAGVEGENPAEVEQITCFNGYLKSCIPTFSLTGVTSDSIPDPETHVTLTVDGRLHVDARGISMDAGNQKTLTATIKCVNGYGEIEHDILIELAPAVLIIKADTTSAPEPGNIGTYKVIAVTTSRRYETSTSTRVAIYDVGAQIDFSSEATGVYEFDKWIYGSSTNSNPTLQTSFDKLTGTDPARGEITGMFAVSNTVRIRVYGRGSGQVWGEKASGESFKSANLEPGEQFRVDFWEMGANLSDVVVNSDHQGPMGSKTLKGEHFSKIYTAPSTAGATMTIGGLFDAPGIVGDIPPETDEDEEEGLDDTTASPSGGISGIPLADLPDPADLGDYPLVSAVEQLSTKPPEWNDAYQNYLSELQSHLPTWEAQANNPDLPEYMQASYQDLVDSAKPLVSAGTSTTSTTSSTIPTGAAASTYHPTVIGETSDPKKSNAAYGAAAAMGLMFMDFQPTLYKPYWSTVKPTKTAPGRFERKE